MDQYYIYHTLSVDTITMVSKTELGDPDFLLLNCNQYAKMQLFAKFEKVVGGDSEPPFFWAGLSRPTLQIWTLFAVKGYLVIEMLKHLHVTNRTISFTSLGGSKFTEKHLTIPNYKCLSCSSKCRTTCVEFIPKNETLTKLSLSCVLQGSNFVYR